MQAYAYCGSGGSQKLPVRSDLLPKIRAEVYMNIAYFDAVPELSPRNRPRLLPDSCSGSIRI